MLNAIFKICGSTEFAQIMFALTVGSAIVFALFGLWDHSMERIALVCQEGC